jgi:hypothetical protein
MTTIFFNGKSLGDCLKPVASGVPPDVEGVRPAAWKRHQHPPGLRKSSIARRRTCVMSAGRDAPALRQARTPAATAAPRTSGVFKRALSQISRFEWLALIFCLCLLCPQKLSAQPAATAVRPANRWLLIVETSRATQSRAGAVAQIAGNLVLSGMNGQLRPGDTLGVWTFNDALHAGGFPLQTWSPENAKNVAERVALLLARQKFENRPNLDKVLPALGGVITNSEFITVILITSGGETMRGTPYDRAINSIHKQSQSQQEKALMPFVTVLRAQAGRITDYKANTPPTTLEMPALPPELLITNAPPPKPPEIKPAEILPPAPVVPSLIVHGKKPVPESESVSNPAPATTEIPPPAPVPATNQNAAGETNITAPPKAPALPATNAGAVAANISATNISAPVPTNQTATATTAATTENSGGKTLWFVGAVAVVAGIGLVLLLVRRSRSGSHTSLITRSLDRDKK